MHINKCLLEKKICARPSVPKDLDIKMKWVKDFNIL